MVRLQAGGAGAGFFFFFCFETAAGASARRAWPCSASGTDSGGREAVATNPGVRFSLTDEHLQRQASGEGRRRGAGRLAGLAGEREIVASDQVLPVLSRRRYGQVDDAHAPVSRRSSVRFKRLRFSNSL